jgi:hypothetical protein
VTRLRTKITNLPPGVYHCEAKTELDDIEDQDRPDLSDIKILTATSFLQFCRIPGVKVMQLNKDKHELNTEPQPSIILPNLSEKGFEAILRGQEDITLAKKAFPEPISPFIDECFHPCLLKKVTEADIEKFIASKPEQTREDILLLE